MALQIPDVNEELVEKIVDKLKSQGIFDQFRKDCLADVDSRPAYGNLKDKVNGAVADFLSKQSWKDDLNKIQVRESLRNHVQQHYLEVGVNKIVEQVVNPKIFSVFMPKVEDVVYQVMGIEKPASTGDGTHNRLRFLMSNHLNQGNVFSDNMLADLDPVSPGSINESGNESANLNDSIVSKIVDESDNMSRDVNKESNLEINEASNESKLSGMSELSSHGSTTKLDISESAHLPGDKSAIHCDISHLQNHSNASDRNRSKGVHEIASGAYDFDNFSNLKEKLMKSDPLNKNLDKDKNDLLNYISSKAPEGSEATQNDDSKEPKDETISMNEHDNKADKVTKSPTSIFYSEDSVGSNGSQRSKLKLEKIHLLNESTRNSVAMECDDSSASFIDKKNEGIKEIETVSCIESLKEESQMSLASNDSRRFNNFENLKVISECSQNISAASSPDASKNMIEDKKKDDYYRKSSNSGRSKDRYDSSHRSRNASRDRKYSRDSKSRHDSDSKKYSSSRDKYSSRSRDDRHRNDSKSHQKSSTDDAKRDRDSRHSYDDKYRRDRDSKHRSGDDHRSSRNRGKESSHNSSEEDKKGKISDPKDKDLKSEKSSRDRSSHENKYSSRKEDYKRSSDYQKYSKSKEGESKYSSTDQKGSKEKSSRPSEDDRYFRKDKDPKKSDDYKTSRNRDKDDNKNSNSADRDSKSNYYDRKSSSSRYKDTKNASEDDKNSQKDKSKISETRSESKSLHSIDDKSNIGGDSKTEKKQCSDKKEELPDKRKSLSESGSKKDDKDSKKRKRENCSEDAEKKENRRSRDRDDGGNRSSGSSSIRDHKESTDKKRKTTSSKQEKPTSSDKDNSAKDNSEGNNCLSEEFSPDKIVQSSVKDEINRENETVCVDFNTPATDNKDQKASDTMNEISVSNKNVENPNSNNEIVNMDIIEDVCKANLQKFENEDELSCTNALKDVMVKEQTLINNMDELVNRDMMEEGHEMNLGDLQKQKDPPATYYTAGDPIMEKELNLSIDSPEKNAELCETVDLGGNKECPSINPGINLEPSNLCGSEKTEPLELATKCNDKSEVEAEYYCTGKPSGDETTEDAEFMGFDQSSMDFSFKSALDFENFLKNHHGSALHEYFSDKCFSLTDNNLNNISIKTEMGHLIESHGSKGGLSPSCSDSKTDRLLSPLSNTVVEDVLNENVDILNDPVVTKKRAGAKSAQVTLSSPKCNDEAVLDKTAAHVHLSKKITQAIPRGEVGSICDGSSSDRGFTLPPVTEDMLDNFMMENIVDKMDGGYNSSDSDSEEWNVPASTTPAEKDDPASDDEINVSKDSSSKKMDSSMLIIKSKENSQSCTSVAHQETHEFEKVETKFISVQLREVMESSPTRGKCFKTISTCSKLDTKSSSSPSKDDETTRLSQRYSDGDLYKPRPLITNPSRRNRVSNKNGGKPSRSAKRAAHSMESRENKRPR